MPRTLRRVIDSCWRRVCRVSRFVAHPSTLLVAFVVKVLSGDCIPPRDSELVRLGSVYGGWWVVDRPNLVSCRILSAGLGEDASFDAEVASRYEASVTVVDPTPRAIIHFNAMLSRLGQVNETAYSRDGNQQVESYDLSSVSVGQIGLLPVAIGSSSGKGMFYPPSDAGHVSYSLANLQRQDHSSAVEVPVMTVRDIMQVSGIQRLYLLKLDVEGVETEVVRRMFEDGIYPSQILLEYDELHHTGALSSLKVWSFHRFMVRSGYVLRMIESSVNCTYERLANEP
jgi:FkbM family methyltransferase